MRLDDINEGLKDAKDNPCWKGYHPVGTKEKDGRTVPNCVPKEGSVAEGWQEDARELEDWSKEVNKKLYRAHESQRPGLARQLSKVEQKNFGSSLNQGGLTELVHAALMALQKGQMVHYDPQSVGQMPFGSLVGDDARIIAAAGVSSDELVGYRMLSDKGIVDNIKQFLQLRRVVWNKDWPAEYLDKFAGNPGALWLQFVKDLNWSKDDVREEVQAKTDDKLLAYYAQRKAEAEKKKKEQGVAEGSGNIGSAIKSLYQKIYNAGDDEIEYFYNDSPIFAQYWDEYEGDLDSIIAEVDPKELQIMHDELESYVQQANLAEANPTMTVNKKSALSQAVAEAGWGRRYTSYHDELSSRDRDEQNHMDQSKRDFKRAEMQHELGHENDPNFERNLRQQQMAADRGPWYIRIDGKIYKQKGIAKSFDWKRGANNYALAMIKNNPSLQGKIMLSKSAEDK